MLYWLLRSKPLYSDYSTLIKKIVDWWMKSNEIFLLCHDEI